MPAARFRSIAVIGVLGLAIGSLSRGVRCAAVIVINNRSGRTIQFTLEPTWSGEAHFFWPLRV